MSLRRRFTETRRRHPIAGDIPMRDAIAAERRMMASLRDPSDVIIDTTHLAPTELRSIIRARFRTSENQGLLLTILSFGFRNGLPRESDIVLMCVFLKTRITFRIYGRVGMTDVLPIMFVRIRDFICSSIIQNSS